MSLHRPLSQIDSLVIHCSASPNGRWTTVEDIDRWHGPDREARGLRPFVRSGSPWHMPHLQHIGYHFVIYTNGGLSCGRGLTETGAHALAKRQPRGSDAYYRYNHNAIATCLIGTDQFSAQQWEMLALHVRSFMRRFPGLEIIGHRDIDDGKRCPCFDVSEWMANDMVPSSENIFHHTDQETP